MNTRDRSERTNKICLAANTSWYLLNFRKELIKLLLARGYSVWAVCPEDLYTQPLRDLGCEVSSISLPTSGLNPCRELLTVVSYRTAYAKVQPDLLLNFTIRPVIFGSIAADICRTRIVNTITGLGTVFLSLRLLRPMVRILLRYALSRAKAVVFQNVTDARIFEKDRLVLPEQVLIIPGSGVNTRKFSFASCAPQGKRVFLFVGRLLRDKGIYEFIEAAKRFSELDDVEFRVAGHPDAGNRSSIRQQDIQRLSEESGVKFLGHLDDIRPALREATCVVLPSYREGMSRSLLEAASIGRPLIASDVPGCREIVLDGWNGYLFPARSVERLANAIRKIYRMSEPELTRFGKNSRTLVEKNFDVDSINRAYLDLIEGFMESG